MVSGKCSDAGCGSGSSRQMSKIYEENYTNQSCDAYNVSAGGIGARE